MNRCFSVFVSLLLLLMLGYKSRFGGWCFLLPLHASLAALATLAFALLDLPFS